MPKPNYITLASGPDISILYEDRSVLAVDKPAGWMLAPNSWDKTARNLQLALESSVQYGDFWARSRNLKFIRFIHRLDADTSGILLLAKSQGVLPVFSQMFESGNMQKTYWAIVQGIPKQKEWICTLRLAPLPQAPDRMRVDQAGKDAETHFRVLKSVGNRSLIEARPVTGRTHQIRVHLTAAGYPIVGDVLYGNLIPVGGRLVMGPARETAAAPGRDDRAPKSPTVPHTGMGLRAVALKYVDPFQHRRISITAPTEEFLQAL